MAMLFRLAREMAHDVDIQEVALTEKGMTVWKPIPRPAPLLEAPGQEPWAWRLEASSVRVLHGKGPASLPRQLMNAQSAPW